jgi:gamma-glutamyl phosphate reductase
MSLDLAVRIVGLTRRPSHHTEPIVTERLRNSERFRSRPTWW